jgi:hypothetical protein
MWEKRIDFNRIQGGFHMRIFLVLFGILVLGVTGVMASSQYDNLAKLVKSGTSEDVIIAYINRSDSSFNLTSDQVVELSKLGASSHLILAAMKHKVPMDASASVQSAPVEAASVSLPHRYLVYRVAPPWSPWRPNNWYTPSMAKKNQAFQIDAAALMYGDLSLNYEYLIAHQHGFVVEGSYYPGYSDWDNNWKNHGEYAELAYRWHWAKSMNSGFIGAFVNGGKFHGTYRLSPWDNTTGYAQTSVTVGPDIGKRWVSDFGMSIVAKIGYGYTWSKFADPIPDQHTQNRLRWDTGLDSELSIGFAF